MVAGGLLLRLGKRAAWSPHDLSRSVLKAWWCADDHGTARMTDDGAGLISSWADRIAGLAAVGTTTQRPTWTSNALNSAYAGLTFDGAATVLHAASTAGLVTGSAGGEVWVLGSQDAPGTGTFRCAFTYGSGAGGRVTYRNVAAGVNRVVFSDEVVSAQDVATNFSGAFISGGAWAAAAIGGRLNGAPISPTSAVITLNTNTTGLGIGARWYTSASLFWLGVIRHVIVTTTLTANQRLQMEGWLAWDAGLASLLPASHPFKLSPP